MNKSKRKGTDFEVGVVNYLREHGFPDADRCPPRGSLDQGDVQGVPAWTLELKAEKSMDLSGYLTEAEREAGVAKNKFFAAVVKRRMKSISESYVVMPLRVFAEFVRESQ